MKIFISDYWLTGLVFFVGVVFLGYGWMVTDSLTEFLTPFRESPVFSVGFYLWLKSLVVDVTRIQRKEKTMPGLVFWGYGLQLAVFLMINDLIFNNINLRLSEISVVENWLFYKNFWLFWLFLDSLVSVFLWPISYSIKHDKSTVTFVVLDMLKSVVTISIFVIVVPIFMFVL